MNRLILASLLLTIPNVASAQLDTEPPAWQQLGDLAKNHTFSDADLKQVAAGIAHYPDDVLRGILDAAQHPKALHVAATGGAQGSALLLIPEPVKQLMQHPETLRSMNENLIVTSVLGAAYSKQPQDVWKAISIVRAEIAAAIAAEAAAELAPSDAAIPAEALLVAEAFPAEGAPVAGGLASAAGSVVVAGRLLVPALTHYYDHHDHDHFTEPTSAATAPPATQPPQAGETVVTELPNGVKVQYEDAKTQAAGGAGAKTVTTSTGQAAHVRGAGGAAVTTQGDTTTGVVGGAGSVTLQDGRSAAVAGAAQGQVSQTANGATFKTDAAGGVATNTGKYAAGVRSTQGAVQYNNDGSTDFQRSKQAYAETNNGYVATDADVNAHVTRDGDGSYDKTKTIDSNRGSAVVESEYQGGEFTRTVTKDDGTTKTRGTGDANVNQDYKQTKQNGTHRELVSAATQQHEQNWSAVREQWSTLRSNPQASPQTARSTEQGSWSSRLQQGSSTGTRQSLGTVRSSFGPSSSIPRATTTRTVPSTRPYQPARSYQPRAVPSYQPRSVRPSSNGRGGRRGRRR